MVKIPQRQAYTPTYCPQLAPWPRVVDVAGINLAFVMRSSFSVKPFLALLLLIMHFGLCDIFAGISLGWMETGLGTGLP